MVLLYVVTQNNIKDAESATAKAQSEQAVAQATIGQLQSYGNFAALKASREQAVAGVAQARFDYERLMREVALVLPHNTYLTSFSATAGAGTAAAGTASAPTVNASGCAPSHPGVATAVVRLRKLHNLTDVNLTSSTESGTTAGSAAGATSACPVTWVAVLTFNPETTPTTPQRVPARLGGGQ
jgi:Tfp pilus assembly protein PilN